MTVFKYFLKLASRQRGVILLYLGIFILISLLTSSSMEKAPAGFATIKPAVKIIQQDHSALADSLVAGFLQGFVRKFFVYELEFL